MDFFQAFDSVKTNSVIRGRSPCMCIYKDTDEDGKKCDWYMVKPEPNLPLFMQRYTPEDLDGAFGREIFCHYQEEELKCLERLLIAQGTLEAESSVDMSLKRCNELYQIYEEWENAVLGDYGNFFTGEELVNDGPDDGYHSDETFDAGEDELALMRIL